jgi:hypothetical protein
VSRKAIIVSRDAGERMTLAQVMRLAQERGLGERVPAEVRWDAREQQWSISWANPPEERGE